MNNLKVSTRLLLLTAVLSVLLTAVGGLGLFGLGKANESLKTVYEDRTVPAGQLGSINALMLHNRIAINNAAANNTPVAIEARTAQVESNIAAISKNWDAYMATRLTPQEEQLAKTFAESRKKLVQDGILPAVVALRAGDAKQALTIVSEKIVPLGESAEKELDALIALQLDEARKEYVAGEARYATIRTTTIGAILGGLAFGLLFGIALVRSVTRQLGGEPGEATSLAQNVAAGNLDVQVNLRPGDNASLMAQLKTMQDNLSKVVSNVRQNAEGVATASAQIAQGNQDLSSRTEEQASALEETAASMEELSSTVKQNADNARQANQLALNASVVATKGGDVVGQVVNTMKGINDSSKKISDIISVIDGIAFQTNILALNAAVEAARAGEQGRGFAVVASEVRSLAHRSAEAAKEIKSLINASVERVEQGTTLVDQAGVTMTEVVTAIKRVTDIMGEISSASTEQSAGVSQVGEAVSQMDQATQQNAALVEESAAAAESLKSQAQQLVQAVAVFKLAHGASAPVPPAARHSTPAQPAAAAPAPQAKPAVDRRGPNRATNVARMPAKAAPAAPAAPLAPPAKNGTDDWETF